MMDLYLYYFKIDLEGLYMKIGIHSHKIKSLFFSWLFSYLLIILITIIISIFAYGVSLNVIRSETNRAHMESLNQVKQVIDSKISDIQRISVEASLNERINSFVNLRSPISTDNRLAMIKVIKDMKTYKTANGFIGNLYIYFRTNNFIISSEARYDTKDFYNIYYNDYDTEYLKWETILKDKHLLEYVRIGINTKDKTLKNTINFMQSLPLDTRSVNAATLVVEIDEADIQQYIEKLKWGSQGTIIIQDKDNNIVATTQPISLPQSLAYNKLDKVQDVFNSKVNNKKVVVSYSKSNISSWKYISVVPKSIFEEKLKYVYRVFVFCVLLCILVGGLISYMITKLNYNPINKLIKMLNNNQGMLKKSAYNEYVFIENSIADIISEKDRVYKKLDKQKDVLKNNFLSRLIKGKQQSSILFNDVCKSYDIQFNGNYYAVILFYIEDFSDLYFGEKNADINSDETIDMVHFIMSNIVDNKIKEKYNGYMTVVNDMLICLANFKQEETHNVMNELKTVITEAKELMEKKFDIYFSASVSELHIGVEGIPIAYQEAIEAIEYKMIIGNGSVIRYDEINSSKEIKSNESRYIYEEQQFMNCIRVGDFKNAKFVLCEIFKNDFSETFYSIQLAKCKMFGLINIMLNAISEISVTCEHEFIENLNLANELLSCKTIFELQSKMIYILDMVEVHLNDKKEIEISGVIKDIIVFIESNYQDPILNVSMTADKFNMGIVSLSKLFKKYSGIGMLDYINKLRIKNAKQLIKDKNLSIKEIGEKVGFYNSAAFIRVFKKYEGTTPGKYKETIK